MVRLSKRMSELNLCSRRQADKLILQSQVILNNQPVEPILGQKVNAHETNIQLLAPKIIGKDGKSTVDRGDTILLNKPKDFVSGQPDPRHGHVPAVRLLTRDNIHCDTVELRGILSDGNYLHFGKRFHEGNEGISTLIKYAPAGRLDLDSSGLLLFTKNGVAAKHILTNMDKEYLVKVEPAQSLSRDELRKGMQRLPYPPIWDLSVLLKGGKRLWDDEKRLRPLLQAEWVEEGKNETGKWNGTGVIKMVLQEGKKRQIRRMCRELLGLHVLELERTRVGSVELGDLPVGKWRPLTDAERLSLVPKSTSTTRT